MSDTQAIKLVSIFLTISDLYDADLKYYCQRFTNNNSPEFTDIELITIYLFAMIENERFTILQIYKFTSEYLISWFPKLPSYVAFNTRLNNLGAVFQRLTEILIQTKQTEGYSKSFSLLDSMPIITCSGKRKAKVAPELTDKGYSSTKGFYYYGLKLHLLAFHKKGSLPFPESFIITPASENDLNVFKQYWADEKNRTYFGDKIYHNSDFFNSMYQNQNSIMLTPIKAVKGQAKCIKQRDKAFNDLFSTAVSKVRQPIEAFFNWLIQKTDIQRASKVRSTKGLIIHIFGRIAAALLIFNS